MVEMNFRRGEYTEYSGLHTDTKPTRGIQTGSLFFEVDTGDVYAFNRDGEEWVLQFSLQGE